MGFSCKGRKGCVEVRYKLYVELMQLVAGKGLGYRFWGKGFLWVKGISGLLGKGYFR